MIQVQLWHARVRERETERDRETERERERERESSEPIAKTHSVSVKVSSDDSLPAERVA